MTQQFASTRDMLQQIAFAKLNRDGTEEDMAKGMLTSIVDDTIKNIAKTSERLTTSMATTLSQLDALGYDKDSDITRSLVSTNMQLQASLVKLAEAGINVVTR